MMPFIGKRIVLDNSDTFRVLNWKPTPMPDSFLEMAAEIAKRSALA
jgi:hypothetical protein